MRKFCIVFKNFFRIFTVKFQAIIVLPLNSMRIFDDYQINSLTPEQKNA